MLEPGLAASAGHEEALAVPRHAASPVGSWSGRAYRAGGLLLRVLWPSRRGNAARGPEPQAIVLVATYGVTDALLSADAESDVTSAAPEPEVEILKVASTDPRIRASSELRELRPQVAVIMRSRQR